MKRESTTLPILMTGYCLYERQRAQDQSVISQEQRQKIVALCADFDRLFKRNITPDRDRKRMVWLLIEDVTLTKSQKILVQIRFKGGMQETHELPLPKNAFEEYKHSPEVITEIDNLLDEHAVFAYFLSAQTSGNCRSFKQQ